MFGLKLVRVLIGDLMGLGYRSSDRSSDRNEWQALDTTKMVATIAVCASGIVYPVCSTTKIRNICYDISWDHGGHLLPLLEARSVIVLGICAAVSHWSSQY